MGTVTMALSPFTSFSPPDQPLNGTKLEPNSPKKFQFNIPKKTTHRNSLQAIIVLLKFSH